MKILTILNSANDWIAIKSNAVFATMGFFWFCLIFSLLPLKYPASMPFVQYASSGVLQLIALPLLGVGTILASRSSDRLAKEQHDAVLESHEEIKALLAEDDKIEVRLSAIEAKLDQLLSRG